MHQSKPIFNLYNNGIFVSNFVFSKNGGNKIINFIFQTFDQNTHQICSVNG